MDTVVTPNQASTVVTGGRNDTGHQHYQRHGLEGKDVAAINEMFTLQTLRGVTTDIHQVARDIEVNIEKSGRANELATEKTAAASQLFLSNGFAATALAAATNTAAIQAAIAQCCCETQALVTSQANETRDLINTLNTQNLNTQLIDSKNLVAALKAKLGVI